MVIMYKVQYFTVRGHNIQFAFCTLFLLSSVKQSPKLCSNCICSHLSILTDEPLVYCQYSNSCLMCALSRWLRWAQIVSIIHRNPAGSFFCFHIGLSFVPAILSLHQSLRRASGALTSTIISVSSPS